MTREAFKVVCPTKCPYKLPSEVVTTLSASPLLFWGTGRSSMASGSLCQLLLAAGICRFTCSFLLLRVGYVCFSAPLTPVTIG